MRPIDADALMEYCNNLTCKTIDANDIARFPTVGGWISVKERFPEENVDCIFYIEWTGLSGNKYREIRIGSMEDFLMDMVEPIAWMPLPEPPKEVTTDD